MLFPDTFTARLLSRYSVVPFAGTFIRENAILSGVSIKPAGSVNVSTQVIDTSRPVTLAINVERNNNTTGGEIPNNILRETVLNLLIPFCYRFVLVRYDSIFLTSFSSSSA